MKPKTEGFWECIACGLRYDFFETCPKCKPALIGRRTDFPNTEDRIKYLQKTIQELLKLVK